MVMRALFAVLLLVALAQARIRIVCPPSAPGGDDENQTPSSASPCGAGVNMADPAITFTDVAPGFQSVMWLETVAIEDSPISIRLCTRAGDCSYVLVDHVPHRNHGPQILQSAPNTRYENRPHMLSIPIPDVACNDCFLQLIQIGRESFPSGDDCTYNANYTGTCTRSPNVQYVACAPIKINGTGSLVYNPTANGLTYTTPNGWPHDDRQVGSYRQYAGNNAAWDWPVIERNTLVYGYRTNNPSGIFREPRGTCSRMFTAQEVNFVSAYTPAQFTPSGSRGAASGLSSALALVSGIMFAIVASLF